MSSREINIICSSETWLSSNVYNAELFPNSYNIRRCDRNFRKTNTSRRGGVIHAYQDQLTTNISSTTSYIDIAGGEFIGIWNVDIFVIYIPPFVFVEYIEDFSLFLPVGFPLWNVFLVGDFNDFPDIDSNDNEGKSLKTSWIRRMW